MGEHLKQIALIKTQSDLHSEIKIVEMYVSALYKVPVIIAGICFFKFLLVH